MIDPLNKLCKWRSLFAGWIGGTRAMHSDGVKGLRDLVDKNLVFRTEANAMASLLIEKGIFTSAELTLAVYREAAVLDKAYEAQFPGFSTSEEGLVIYDPTLARETTARLGFPP